MGGRDDFALFAGLAYTGLGTVLVIDESGLHELGDLWYPLPPNVLIVTLIQNQETLVFAAAVCVVGLLTLAIWAGVPLPLWVRVTVPWMGWVLAVNLTMLRFIGFMGPINPPWWATVLLTMFLLVITKRRICDLHVRNVNA